jgi:hypothetical protein
VSTAEQVAPVLRPYPEQHLDADIVEAGEQRLAEHGIVGADRERDASGVKLTGESEEGEVGLLTPRVGLSFAIQVLY